MTSTFTDGGGSPRALRVSAELFLGGVVLSIVAGLLHPGGAKPNDHPAAFAEYASNSSWTLVHLGQFAGMAVLLCGLIALFFALNVRSGGPGWFALFGLVAAVVALALYGVLQAVDGVALKQAVDAWAAAPEADKAARFASAEGVRWLEWAARSYQSFVLGASLVLFGTVIAWTGRLSRVLGYLMALAGVAYLVQGWVLGVSGFSDANSIPTLAGIVLMVATGVYLLVVALRVRIPVGEASRLAAG